MIGPCWLDLSGNYDKNDKGVALVYSKTGWGLICLYQVKIMETGQARTKTKANIAPFAEADFIVVGAGSAGVYSGEPAE